MRKSHNASFLVAGVVLELLGCGPEVREPDPTYRQFAATISVPQYQGYTHSFSKTRFVLGSEIQSITEGGFQKIVGDQGVFATDVINGAVLAIPNASSGREQTEAFTDDPDSNNSAVLAYFTGAGIPPSQVGSVNVTTVVSGTGTLPNGMDAPMRFVAFNSVLQRQLNGIVVEESFAWARLAKDGSAVIEGVYWPEIDANVVDDAAKLVQTWADAVGRAQILARAGLTGFDSGSGHVVIHHSPFWYHGAFRTHAVIDETVSALGGKARTIHLDASGNSVVFDEEQPSLVPSVTR